MVYTYFQVCACHNMSLLENTCIPRGKTVRKMSDHILEK